MKLLSSGPIGATEQTAMAQNPPKDGRPAGRAIAGAIPRDRPAQHATPDEAAALMTSMLALLRQQGSLDESALALIEPHIERALAPAPRQWLLARVVSVLSHYPTSGASHDVIQSIAEDWAHELGELPAWAIQDACRWWISSSNPFKHQKPIPGNISGHAQPKVDILRLIPQPGNIYGGWVAPYLDGRIKGAPGMQRW